MHHQPRNQKSQSVPGTPACPHTQAYSAPRAAVLRRSPSNYALKALSAEACARLNNEALPSCPETPPGHAPPFYPPLTYHLPPLPFFLYSFPTNFLFAHSLSLYLYRHSPVLPFHQPPIFLCSLRYPAQPSHSCFEKAAGSTSSSWQQSDYPLSSPCQIAPNVQPWLDTLPRQRPLVSRVHHNHVLQRQADSRKLPQINNVLPRVRFWILVSPVFNPSNSKFPAAKIQLHPYCLRLPLATTSQDRPREMARDQTPPPDP